MRAAFLHIASHALVAFGVVSQAARYHGPAGILWTRPSASSSAPSSSWERGLCCGGLDLLLVPCPRASTRRKSRAPGAAYPAGRNARSAHRGLEHDRDHVDGALVREDAAEDASFPRIRARKCMSISKSRTRRSSSRHRRWQRDVSFGRERSSEDAARQLHRPVDCPHCIRTGERCRGRQKLASGGGQPPRRNTRRSTTGSVTGRLHVPPRHT